MHEPPLWDQLKLSLGKPIVILGIIDLVFITKPRTHGLLVGDFENVFAPHLVKGRAHALIRFIKTTLIYSLLLHLAHSGFHFKRQMHSTLRD